MANLLYVFIEFEKVFYMYLTYTQTSTQVTIEKLANYVIGVYINMKEKFMYKSGGRCTTLVMVHVSHVIFAT